MTREEQLDRMLQYLGERKETGGTREFCERELGMDAEAYQALVGRLLRDGMAEWNPHQDLLSITAQGRFLLIGGGYEILVFSRDYQRKQRREARHEIVRTILNRGRSAALRWGKFGTVVGKKPGPSGRNQPGTVTRDGRKAPEQPGNPPVPNQDGPDAPNRSRPETLQGWFNETNLLRLTAVAVLISMLFIVVLLTT